MSLIIGVDDEVTRKADLGEKIRELCEALLTDDNVADARRSMDAFVSNPDATAGYAALVAKSEELQAREQSGGGVSEAEAEAFESQRRTVLSDPRVQSFMEARGMLQEVESFIMAYVSRTLELGRIPSESELMPKQGGGCGEGCGCH